MSYASFSYGIYGNLSRALKPYFIDIKDDMQKANISYTLEEYLSMAFFTVTVTFFVEAVFLSFMLGLFTEPALAIILSFILSSGISALLFFIFYTYPATVSKNRENKIQKVLPFAISYLTTLSSSKAQPIVLFKTIGRFKEYGEVAKEFNDIASNIELFGLTASAAIKKQAKITPSAQLRDILWGINTVLISGGDLTMYLRNKSENLMNDYRGRIKKFSQQLSLYVEIYLTLIIAGSIFFIVLSSIISTLSAGLETVIVQTFVAFVLLPLISIMFIILVKAVSPLE